MNKVNDILNNELFQISIKKICNFERKRIFCKHDLGHLLNVARIMLIKAYEEDISIDKEVIYSTALLHDIGRGLQYENGEPHVKAGVKIAKKILSQCNYNKREIEMISFAILNHNDLEETDQLSSLLKYADKISRNCFLCSAYKECNWSEEKKNKGVIL